MCVVYKAQDTKLPRYIAIKVLRPEALGDPDAKKRFIREAHAASTLNHPNITTIYEIDQWRGQDFIVMEFIKGQTLKAIIKNEKLKIKNVIDFAIQMAEALTEAHEHNIIHRDIKSGNIMLTAKAQIKVMDFGLAKIVGSVTKTNTRTTMGTIAYMSPEQTKGKGVDFRTDIWSLGVVLYEMITGELPFKGDYEQAVIYSILNEEPEKISALRSDVPPTIEHIVYKALAKKKQARFASARDLLSELRMLFEPEKLILPIKPDQQKEDDNADILKRRTKWTIKNLNQKRPIIVLTIVLFIIVFGFIIKVFLKKNTPILLPTVTCLTSYPNIESYPALSPDGSKLAFSWNGEKGDNTDIYIKLIGEDGYTQLTSDSAKEFSATWSSDGNYLAFIRYGENAGIYRQSIIGGRETKLTDMSQTEFHFDMEPRIDWSPDGKWLVFNDYDSLRHTNCLFRLHLDSGEKEQITFAKPALVGDMNPKFSPDGKLVAFERAYGHRIRELYLLNLKNCAMKQLTSDKKQIDDLAWTPDGKRIIFISNRGGFPRLWSIGSDGRRLKPFEIGGEHAIKLSISRTTHRLVYATQEIQADILQAEIPKEYGLIRPYRLISSTKDDYFSVYSPDEQKIAFNSDRTGNTEIFVCNQDGSDPVRITFLETHSGVPRWSPSGEHIIFDSQPNGNGDIMKVDVRGVNQPDNLTNHPADDRIPSWSSDGHHIYFGSNRAGGRYQIFRMSVNGDQPEQITQNGGFFGFESFDKAYFYFKKYGDTEGPIYRIDLKTREESVAIEEDVYSFRWVLEKNGIYYISADKNNNPILKIYRFDTGLVEQLGTLESWFSFGDVSNDGTNILLWPIEGYNTDIYLVDHFQ